MKTQLIWSHLRNAGKPSAIVQVKNETHSQTVIPATDHDLTKTEAKAVGTVTYKGVGTNKKSKKALKINAKTGKITVKKNTKKGTYKMKVTVEASGNTEYSAATKTVTVTVKVK